MSKKRNFQTRLEPLFGISSRYICLRGLVKLKKSDYELRHWIGYRKKSFEPGEVNAEKLIDYVLEAMSGEYSRPARKIIPEQVSGLFHIGGFYFKIFEQEFGRALGMPRCFAPRVLSERLLYSESWNDIMGAIEERGLIERLKEAREKREQLIKKGKPFIMNVSDYVRNPEIEKMFDELGSEEYQKRSKEHPSDIPICTAF